MHGEYNVSLVLLSFAVAVLASHVTLSVAARVKEGGAASAGVGWIVSGALAMGTGIWLMHFIGMLAYRTPFRQLYDPGLTAASFVVAVAVSGFALLRLRRSVFRSLDLALAGVLLGIGIAAMHYLGMYALQVSPAIDYDPLMAAASVLIAIAASTAALWICFNLDRVRHVPLPVAQLISAVVLGVAIAGMHYLGMAAMILSPDTAATGDVGLTFGDSWVGYALGAPSVVLLIMAMLLSFYDERLRAEAARSSEQLKRANEELEARVAERTRTLAQAEARMTAILRDAPDAIMVMDSRGTILAFNPAAERIYRCKADQAIGRKAMELFITQSDAKIIGNDLGAYVLQKHEWVGSTREARARRYDGTEFFVEYTLVDTRDEDFQFLTIYVRDITQRREDEQALRKAKETAEAASNAKSAFLATISHEIRTPMNAIMGTLELLGLSSLDLAQRDALRVLQESSESLLHLIDDVLDFSKIEAGKLEIATEAGSLQRVAEAVVNSYRSVSSRKGLVLRYDCDERVEAALSFDPLRVRQILGNFLSNAIKFTERGSVAVGIRVVETDARTQTVLLVVRDTGIGIDKDTQQRLFQPFEQGDTATTRRYGGTGLGLAICKRLVDLMGGEVRISSEPGLGTTIAAELVLRIEDALPQPAPAEARPEQSAARTASGTALTILAIDDHPTNLHLLRQQLTRLGYNVLTAGTSGEAVRVLERHEVAAIVTDCQMPDMDGYEFARLVRAREYTDNLPRVPILAFTANSHPDALRICREAGMDGLVVKPASLTLLAAELKRLLGGGGRGAADRTIRAEGDPAAAEAAAIMRSPLDAVMARLHDLSEGDTEQMETIIEEFSSASVEDIDCIEVAFEARDLGSVWRFAHRLKGSLRTVGANQVARHAEDLGVAAADGDWDAAVQAGNTLRSELEKLLSALASTVAKAA